MHGDDTDFESIFSPVSQNIKNNVMEDNISGLILT
jgi:hypothetical protein